MEILRFNNPVFKPGLNCTMRRGYAWAERIGKAPAQSLLPVDIQDSEGNHVCFGKCKYYHICKFCDIKAQWLESQHDPKCRTYNGLRDAMIMAYGDNFSEIEYITVVWFYTYQKA